MTRPRVRQRERAGLIHGASAFLMPWLPISCSASCYSSSRAHLDPCQAAKGMSSLKPTDWSSSSSFWWERQDPAEATQGPCASSAGTGETRQSQRLTFCGSDRVGSLTSMGTIDWKLSGLRQTVVTGSG